MHRVISRYGWLNVFCCSLKTIVCTHRYLYVYRPRSIRVYCCYILYSLTRKNLAPDVPWRTPLEFEEGELQVLIGY